MAIRSAMIPEVEEDGYVREMNFGTVENLLAFMRAEDIPLYAHIEYMGCGSHRIEFVWDDAAAKTTLEDIFPEEIELRGPNE